MSDNSTGVSRRDFMKVSAGYGTTPTLLTAGVLGAGATLTQPGNCRSRNSEKALCPGTKVSTQVWCFWI